MRWHASVPAVLAACGTSSPGSRDGMVFLEQGMFAGNPTPERGRVFRRCPVVRLQLPVACCLLPVDQLVSGSP